MELINDPALLLADAGQVVTALRSAGWSTAALDAQLGATARTHLDRDELAPVLRRTADGSPLSTLARLLVAGVPVDPAAATAAGLPDSWLRPAGSGQVTAAIRLQPLNVEGVELAVPHDPGRAASGVDPGQVLGVGAASLTLAAATPRATVGRVLDLGTGCGIQALLAEDHGRSVVATDRNPRASAFARLAGALNDADLDVRTGDLLEPVAGEHFDLIVSNPPFVISPGPRYTYRDAGLDADEVCARLVRGLPAHLEVGGHAVLLANWLHLEGEDGDERVRSWFPADVDGWVVERELAAPEDYVTAWLRDTDEGPRFDQLYGEWMDWMTERRVEAVAFGVLSMRRRSGPGGSVVHDDVPQAVAPRWGEEVLGHFARRDALAGDLLARAWTLRPDVRLHQVARSTGAGWAADVQLLQQESGLRWSGGVDEHGGTLLAGCDGTRPLGALLSVLAMSTGLTEGEAAEQVLPVVRQLVAQGFLTP